MNRGKQFEQKFYQDFCSIPNVSLDRIYDTQGRNLGVRNVCDFIGYKQPNIFYIECKTIKGNTFPFSNLSQYEKLLTKVGIPGVRAGVIIWFYDPHSSVLYVPISTIKKMKEDGLKSFNIRHLEKYQNVYYYIDIPSTKKRVFMDSDYSCLFDLEEGY